MSIIVETVSGKSIDLTDFKSEDIVIDDIALSLSRQRRYAGHTVIPWSVAQHSIFCSMIADKMGGDRMNIMACFLHDAEEYLMQDFIYPIKSSKLVNGSYKKTCDKVSKVIFDHFGCHNFNQEFVDTVDQLAYCFEHTAFRPNSKNGPQVSSKIMKAYDWLFDTIKMGIPKELIEMSEQQQGQLIYEHLMVFAAEKSFGTEISSDVDLIVEDINAMWKKESKAEYVN